jgi:hypothetical protein
MEGGYTLVSEKLRDCLIDFELGPCAMEFSRLLTTCERKIIEFH